MQHLQFDLSFLTAVLVSEATAGLVTLDFENLSDSTVIGSSYATEGITFTGASIATAGFSLNNAEFPPHSGNNVAIDIPGPMTLAFSTSISSFSGYFTYAQALTLTAYDSLNQVLATANSALSSNYVSSGNSPNEFIQLIYAIGIDHLTITGDPNGSSFTLDDVTFNTNPSSNVPEPGTLFLEILGLGCLIASRSLKFST